MLEIRRDADIHAEDGGWFRARWHFSFDRYRDPAQMGIGPLRVFNDDRLAPGADWPMHPHADVEGITIYYGPGQSGYIIASSQGSSNFKVYDRKPPHTFRGTFSVTGTTSRTGTGRPRRSRA